MANRSYQISDEQRRLVRSLAGCGVRQAHIASIVGIRSLVTLRKHFREELTLGPLEASANVMRTAFQLATSSRHPAMTIFWLKTRARWTEKWEPREAEPVKTVIYRWVPPKPEASAPGQEDAE
jgi:hypothetical protein